MAAGWLTVLGWGLGLALYSSDEYSFLYCRCFLVWFVFLGFVCMMITFFLGIPSLHRLCQDCALLFSFWFEFNVPTWQQFQLNSISFSSEQYNVSCSKQNFRDGQRLVTRENPQTGKMQWKVTCDHRKLISNPRTPSYWQTKDIFFLLRSKDFLPTFTRCNFEEKNLRLPQYYIRGHHWRDSAHQRILNKRSSLLLLLHLLRPNWKHPMGSLWSPGKDMACKTTHCSPISCVLQNRTLVAGMQILFGTARPDKRNIC